MIYVATDQQQLSIPEIAELVAAYLDVRETTIDPDAPFSQYGLDSLTSVGLVAHLSQHMHRELPDYLLLDCPDIRSLHDYLNRGPLQVEHARLRDMAALEQMRSDATLESDIVPNSPMCVQGGNRNILLTGATGFLGSQLLASLLQQEDVRVICMMRSAEGNSASARLQCLLQSLGLWPTARDRVAVIRGDLDEPRCGLSEAQFEDLASRVHSICHCAANVNWALPYEALRATNVSGTREILRLACTGAATPVHFVSTVGVCLATPGPAQVSEEDDPFENLGALHFGYAQSKCVAEQLLRSAAQRGLPVRIYRPSLLSGDSSSGLSDTEGFLSRLLLGCVRMGCAPDLDWLVDCCPVDYVARCIAAVSRSSTAQLTALHLVNPAPRHWRETVLWMNLYGYRVRLLPFADWLERMRHQARDAAHPLHGLQNFFAARPAAGNGLALPELFEESRKSEVRADRTAHLIDGMDLGSPEVDARLLDKYFAAYIEAGRLPAPERHAMSAHSGEPGSAALQTIVNSMRLSSANEPVKVLAARQISATSVGDSIITELSSWRYGNIRGLFPCRLEVRRLQGRNSKFIDVFIKSKPHDSEVIAIGTTVAQLCQDGLGDAFARNANLLGFAGSHVRELGIYAQRDPRFRRFTPLCHGQLADEVGNRWVLVLEYLSNVALIDSANDVRGWTPDYLNAAIDGLAALHAIWYRREGELTRQPWLGPYPTAESMKGAADFWERLADFSRPLFHQWLGPDIVQLQREFVDGMGSWWTELNEMPRTLIHQDFNPRNIAFRLDREGPRLCVYDWELATMGVPQRDLAELLCFVLPSDCCADLVGQCVERHRAALEQATGDAIDKSAWRRGFELSLRDLLVSRLAMYTLINRFRRQEFLRRVTSTWSTIQRHYAHTCRPQVQARG